MANLREFTYPSSDGVHQIHAAEWTPDMAEPRGVVQLVHGISEYVLRYAPFAEFLTKYGFIVVGDDHLGHGKTAKGPQEYGFISERNGWTHLADDVHALRVLTGEKYPGLPYFLLGHSMGSFLARTYLIRWPGTLTGAILSGTGQESAPIVALGKLLSGLGDPHKVNKLVIRLSLGAYNKKFAPNRTGADWISRDEQIVDAYVRDPLCAFVPTAGMNHDMMGGLQFIANKENLAKMDKDTPVYFFSGDQDPVGAMGEGVKKVFGFFQSAGVRDVTMKLYPGGRHEMLNELNRAEVYADVLSWLETHLPA